jgi:hypothetical protein
MTVFLAVAGEAVAQTAVDISILDRGKPVANVDVSSILDAGKVVVATTGTMGTAMVISTASGFSDGDRVEVWVKKCTDGKVEVILAPEGSDDPCADEEAQAGEDCGCDKIGLFIWGDGPVTIDIGTGTVTQTGRGVTAVPADDHSFADLQIGGMFDYSSFYQLEDVVCDQPGVASCEADGGVAGGGVYLDYRFGRSPFGVSLEAHYAKLDVEQTPTGAGAATSYDVNSWQFQAAGVYNVGLSPRAAAYGRLGYAVMYNEGDASSGSQSESRSETGSRLVVGSGLHFPIGENWCSRTGVDLTIGKSDDADTNVRWSFALGYRMNRN